jgi:hypothetical protein
MNSLITLAKVFCGGFALRVAFVQARKKGYPPGKFALAMIAVAVGTFLILYLGRKFLQ